MRKIKFSLLALVSSVILFSNISFSQEDDNYEYNCLADKKWAIVFEAGSFLKNYSDNVYKTFLLTGKYHLNKRNAVRLFIGTSGSLSNGEISGFSTYGNVVTKESKSFNMETGIQYLYYLNPDSRVKVYCCAGPYFNFSHYYSYRETVSGNAFSENLSNIWGLGLAGAFGVEYFILDNISLVGEYTINGTIGKRRESNEYFDQYGLDYIETDNTEYKFDFNKMRIGFSVYF